MVIDLIDKLIDRCIQLVRYREEIHRRLFDAYVEPIQTDFEAVHEDYLETFRKYRAMVRAPVPTLDEHHPVLDAITEDSLFNSKLRMRIHGLMACATDPLLGTFLTSIWKYFYSVGESTEAC